MSYYINPIAGYIATKKKVLEGLHPDTEAVTVPLLNFQFIELITRYRFFFFLLPCVGETDGGRECVAAHNILQQITHPLRLKHSSTQHLTEGKKLGRETHYLTKSVVYFSSLE